MKVSDAEAEEIYQYDQMVEHDTTTGVLEPEKELYARKMSHTGTRERKAPTVYDLKPRKRAENKGKAAIIAALVEFIQSTDTFTAENVEATNAERLIKFTSGGENFELTLTQKRKPKA